ncbi:MAG TPA: fumarylacetoacetate hydrolase family protein [Roseimicrobium sp.]|nr:fumarylacetoacetate hydrolase family protein [Roseimicrobium sp.]
MKLCRFTFQSQQVRIGLVQGDRVLDLSAAGITSITALLEGENPAAVLGALTKAGLPSVALAEITLLAPVEKQDVWAAGVTYLRSKKARMEESDFSASAYDRVYDAPRPEIFFKSMPEKVVATLDAVGIRRDAKWNVPEPELILVINSRGKVAGFSIGNDMSSRDIEGENLLYLPQAKTYNRACAIGPFITVGPTEAEVREWDISITISRGGKPVFEGSTKINQLKRSFTELAEYASRCQDFSNGAMLLTGTGVVPNDDFTLQPGDVVRITISGIGTLENPVIVV